MLSTKLASFCHGLNMLISPVWHGWYVSYKISLHIIGEMYWHHCKLQTIKTFKMLLWCNNHTNIVKYILIFGVHMTNMLDAKTPNYWQMDKFFVANNSWFHRPHIQNANRGLQLIVYTLASYCISLTYILCPCNNIWRWRYMITKLLTSNLSVRSHNMYNISKKSLQKYIASQPSDIKFYSLDVQCPFPEMSHWPWVLDDHM